VNVAPDFKSPSEAKSFIAAMDFFTGARMHACIAAFSSGVPVVPFAYSRKFNGLFSSLQYEFVADGRFVTTEEATAQVLYGLENIATLKVAVDRGNSIARNKLQKYEDYLAQLFLLESQKS
jgi:polysaccharide pyruvyl transferase WcaK-like protein